MAKLPALTPEIINAYQQEIARSSSPSTLKRKNISLNRFFDWAEDNGHIPENPMAQPAPEVPETQVYTTVKPKKKVNAKAWFTITITSALVILLFLLTWKLQFAIPFFPGRAAEDVPESQIQTVTNNQAGPTPSSIPAQVAGNKPWNLFAKLKLTDSNGAPRVGSQTVSFKLYNTDRNGQALYTSNSQTITTDTNGSALISLDDVPTDLFFQNNRLYLEPSFASESGNFRIPINTANVSSNLNGYLAANPDTGAGPETVPIINSEGSLMLAGQSPAIKGKEGNLLIEGQALTLKTADGGGGNIEINPDGQGYVHFLFEASRGNLLNVQGPNLRSGSLIYGMVPNNATGYNLINLQSGAPTMTSKFKVDALGNTFIGGNLNVNGNIATGGTDRLTKEGALTNITGYSQTSGNFTITQGPGDFASITKDISSGSALSDVLTLTLDERGKPETSNSTYNTLVLNRYDGAIEAMALLVNNGNAQFNGQLRLGRFDAFPTAIGTGSLIYNSTDNQVYFWNGSSWNTLAGSGSTSFASITSGTNTTATMVVGSGASLTFSGTGTITASDVSCTGCVLNSELANSTITFAGNSGSSAISLGGTENIVGSNGITTSQAGSTMTVSGVNATTSTVGVASFDPNFFTVTTGNVSMANDSLDFAQFKDAMTLDASTDIATAGLTLSTSGTGALNFASTGQVTFAGNVDATNGLDVTNANLTVGGANFTVDPATGNITTAGNLTVNGNTFLGNAITDEITFTARVAQDSDLIPITTTGTNDLGSASLPWDNIYGVAIFQNGNQVCDTSGNCSSVGNFWQLNSKVLSPSNTTYDVAVGGTATSSAKFQAYGIEQAGGNIATLNSNTITTGTVLSATASAITSGNLVKLGEAGPQNFTGNFILADADNTGGGSFTGNFLRFDNATTTVFTVDASGNLTTSGDAAINGGDVTTTAGTASLFNSGATTLNIGGASTTIELGATTGTTSINNSLTIDGDTTIGNAITDNITFTGRVAQDSDLIPITTTGTNDLGSLALPWDNIYGVAIFQNGNAVCDSSGANCPAGSTNFWQLNAEVLSPSNNTWDVAVGGTATSSSKFQAYALEQAAGKIVTLNSNTITTGTVLSATASAITSGNLIKLGEAGPQNFTGNFILADADNTGGGSFTGNFLRFDNATSTVFTVDASGNLVTSGDAAINGGDITSSATTFNFVNSGVTTLNIGQDATTVSIGDATGTTTINNASTVVAGNLTVQGTTGITESGTGAGLTFSGTGNHAISVSNSTSNLTIDSGNSGLLQLNNSSSGNVEIAGGSGATGCTIANATGDLTCSGDGAFNGGDITTTAGTASLFNSNATTLNIGGAATTIELGATTGTTSINNSLTIDGNTTLGNAITDEITFTARVAQDSDLIPITTTGTNDLGSASLPWDNIYGVTIFQNGNQVCDISGNCSSVGNFWQLNNKVVSPSNSTYDVAVGGTGTSSAKFQAYGIENTSGNIATLTSNTITTGTVLSATASAITSGNIIKLGEGGDQNFSGNGLYMDFGNTGAGGGGFTGNFLRFDNATTTVFTVNSAGNLTTAGDIAVNGGDITTTQSTFNLLNTNATTINFAGAATTLNIGPTGSGASSIVMSGGSGDTGCTLDGSNGNFTCSGNITTTATSGTQGWWQLNNKVVSPSNSTWDVAVGGTATSSAKFQAYGVETAGGNIASLNSNTITTGTLFSATASAITSGNFIKLGSGGNNGNFTGNFIFADADNTGGSSFTGNFLRFDNAQATVFTVDASGNLTTSGDAAINGGDITSSATTFNFVNSGVTTLNIGGAATTLELGATTGTTSVNNSLTVDGNTTLGNAITDEITFTARVAQDSDLIPITTTGTNDLGSVSLPWDNIYGVSIFQNGNQVCDTSGNCSGIGNFWQLNNKVISPANSTWDVAVGGTATSSAKFQAYGVETAGGNIATLNSNTITTGTVLSATASAITSGNIIKLGTGGDLANFTGNGLFMDFDNTGGASFTGNFIRLDNATTTMFTVDASGSVVAAGDAAINGGDITSSSTTFNFVNSGVTTLNIGSAATTVELGAATGTTSINNSLTIDGDTTIGNAITDNITFTGRVAQDSDLIPITTTGTNDLGSASLPWDNIYGVALFQNGNAVCDSSGANCPSGPTNFWSLNGTTLYPSNQTYDVAVGGNSTSSAKFQAYGLEQATGNIASLTSNTITTGTVLSATASAITSGNIIKLGEAGPQNFTGNGLFMDFDNTGGGSFTGNFIRLDNAQSTVLTVDALGTLTTLGDIAVNGGDITTTQTTFNLLNATATTLNFAGAATTLNIGPTGSGASSIIMSGGSADTGCTLDGSTGNFTCSGNITTTATSGTQGWWQLNNKVVSPANSTWDVAVGGTATSSAKFQAYGVETAAGNIASLNSNTITTGTLFNATASAITSGNIFKLGTGGDGAAFTGNGIFMDFDNTGGASFTGNFIRLDNAQSTVFTVNSAGNITTAGDAAINGGDITSSAGTFNFVNSGVTALNIGGAATAIELGATTGTTSINNALTVDGDTTLGNAITDNITFTGRVAQDSDLIPITTTGTNDLGSASLPWDNVYANAFIQNGFNVCDSSGSNCPAGASFWAQLNKVLYPSNQTWDVAVGGDSTASAKFQAYGIENTGGNIASLTSNTITTGNVLSATASAITSGSMIRLGEAGGQNFTGTGLYMDFDNTGGGSFTGNFLQFDNAQTARFTVNSTGDVTFGGSGTHSISTSNSTSNLTIDSGNTGILQLNNNATGNVELAGGSGATGCTVANATGLITCTGGFAANGAGAGLTFSGTGNHDITASTGTLRLGAVTLNGLVSGNGQTITNLGTLDFGTGNVSITGTTIGLTTDTTLLTLNSTGLAFEDTKTLQVGGKTGTAYNVFANSGQSPTQGVISSDNDLFIGGDLEVAGTIFDSAGQVVGGYWTQSGSSLYPTTLTNLVGIGTSAPVHRLSVINNPPGGSLTGKAAFLVDQYENQDILTASASGVTKMTLTNDGTLKLFNASSTITNDTGDITIDAASNFISFAGDDIGNIGTITAGAGVFTGDIAVNGGDITTTAPTFNLANAATTLNLGSTNVTRTINIGTGANADTINIATGDTTADTVNIGNSTVATTLDIHSGATTQNIVDINGTSLTSGSFLAMKSDANRTAFAWDDKDATIAGQIDQTQISNLSDTYVYDTTQDPDGGLWRNGDKAKASSWYNEASGATRSSRRDFPEKAIIASINSNVYIYDAKDNSLWMQFNKNVTGYMIGVISNSTVSSVYGMDGKVYVGTNGSSAEGLFVIDFKADRAYKYNSTNDFVGTNTIANRNSAQTWNAGPSSPIVDSTVNDVSGVIYGGDSFVAASTDTGVSVINESDRTVVSYSDATDNDYNNAVIDSMGDLYALNENLAQLERWNTVVSDSSSELNGTPDVVWDDTGVKIAGAGAVAGPILFVTDQTINISPSDLVVMTGTSTVDGRSDTIYVGHGGGLTVIQDKRGDESNGTVKYYTKDYFSEEMVGDIRGMWPMNLDGASVATYSGTIAQGALVGDVSDKNLDLQVGGSAVTLASGVRNQGLTFDGSTNYISCTDGSCGGTSNLDVAASTAFSYGAWFKTSTTGANQMIISKKSSQLDATPGYTAYLTPSNTATCNIGDGATRYTATSSATFTDNLWHHIVCTSNGTGTLNTFLDGILVATGSGPTSTTLDNAEEFRIARGTQASTFFNGTIDEPFVTEEVLAAGQVRQVFSVGYKAVQNHTASRVTGVTGADTYQSFKGNAAAGVTTTNRVMSVGVDSGNQFIFAGLNDASGNTGGVSVIGVDSDTIVDLYDETANTTKKTDANSQYVANDVISLSVSGFPCIAYNLGPTSCDKKATISIVGIDGSGNSQFWAETTNTSLYSTLATLTSPNQVKNAITVNNVFQVYNNYNNLSQSTTGEQIQTPAFSVDSNGFLSYNYFGPSTTATGATFTDNAGLTTGTLLSLTGANSLTTGSALSVSGQLQPSTGGTTGSLVSISATDTSSSSSQTTVNGLLVTSLLNTTGAGQKDFNGVLSRINQISCNGGSSCNYAGFKFTPLASSTASMTEVGFDVGNLSSAGAASEIAIRVGTGWDTDIQLLDTSPIISIGDTGTLSFTDGTNNLVQITDSSNTGRLAASGSISAGNLTTVAYSRLGTGATDHTLTTADDLLISGETEFRGTIFLDSADGAGSGGSFIIADYVGESAIIFPSDPATGRHTLSAGNWYVNNTKNVGEAALIVNQPTTSFDIFTASSAGTPRFRITNAGDVFLGNNSGTDLTVGCVADACSGTGKVDAGTVDPPYMINGTKYATYLPGMIGVKEEVAGNVNTSEYVPGVGYRQVIDFNSLPEGSDLWLFGKTTNIKENINQMVALLTPSFPTKVWYEVDKENDRVIIYSARPTEISYRLTAPRFDADEWSNYRDSVATGFIINDIDSPKNISETFNIAKLSDFVTEKVNDSTYALKDKSGHIVDGFESIGNFVAANVKAGRGTFDELLVKTGLVAPDFRTKLITPLADETDVHIQIGAEGKDGGKLAIQNAEGTEVAAIDTAGDATFSGEIYAKNIHSENIDAIRDILAEVQADQQLLKDAAGWNTATATESGIIDQIAASDLYITNQAAINSLSVTETATIGTDLVLGSGNTIDTYTAPLKIQSLALAPVEIMAGLVKIDTNGNVEISGDLFVAGKTTTKELSLTDATGIEVGSVNGSGSAEFASVTTPNFVVAAPEATEAGTIVNGVITTNSSIGKAVIPALTREITIKNPKVTDYTLVYITPTSTTNNYVLYIKSKENGKFVVGFDTTLPMNVSFNWWIVQVE